MGISHTKEMRTLANMRKSHPKRSARLSKAPLSSTISISKAVNLPITNE